VDNTYENLNSAQEQEYLDSDEGEGAPALGKGRVDTAENSGADGSGESDDDDDDSSAKELLSGLERKPSRQQTGGFATLALAPWQFAAIQALDRLKWRKYPVWIHKHRHSHAAIIVRTDKPGFEEGKVVLRHWVTEEFLA
jgi:hypothetical protein